MKTLSAYWLPSLLLAGCVSTATAAGTNPCNLPNAPVAVVVSTGESASDYVCDRCTFSRWSGAQETVLRGSLAILHRVSNDPAFQAWFDTLQPVKRTGSGTPDDTVTRAQALSLWRRQLAVLASGGTSVGEPRVSTSLHYVRWRIGSRSPSTGNGTTHLPAASARYASAPPCNEGGRCAWLDTLDTLAHELAHLPVDSDGEPYFQDENTSPSFRASAASYQLGVAFHCWLGSQSLPEEERRQAATDCTKDVDGVGNTCRYGNVAVELP